SAAVTGKREDGSELTGTYRWADKRPLARGYDENVTFVELRYLDPDDIDLGRQLEAILPSLWLAAGGVGDWDVPSEDVGWLMPESSTFAVLLRESRFRELS